MPMQQGMVGWLVIGTLTGAAGPRVAPDRGPGGMTLSVLSGGAGALFGGAMTTAMGWTMPPAPWLGAIAGAVAAIALSRLVVRYRAR